MLDRTNVTCRMEDLQSRIKEQTHPFDVSLLPGGDKTPVPYASMKLGRWCDDVSISGKDADELVTSRGRIWTLQNIVGANLSHFRIELGDFDAKDATHNGEIVKQGKGSRIVYPGDTLNLVDARNCRMEHMEFAWSMDELLGIRSSSGCEFYRCDAIEPLDKAYQLNHGGSQVGKVANHSMGLLQSFIDKEDSGISGGGAIPPNVYRECFFANCRRRTFMVANNGQGPIDARRVNNAVFINNLIYNYGRPFAHTGDPVVGEIRMDLIGNVYVMGPDTPGTDFWFGHWQYLQILLDAGSLYAAHNYVVDKDGEIHALGEFTSNPAHGQTIDWTNNRTAPWYDLSGRPLRTDPKDIEKTVLRYSGCSKHKGRHWRRLRDQFKNNEGKIIDTQEEVA